MASSIEADIRAKGIFSARVIANVPVCREHWRLVLQTEGFPPACAGQFIQILCADSPQESANTGMMLRRPFSIGGLRRRGSTSEIDVIHRAIGRGTHWLAARRPGDRVNILGPLGRPFQTGSARSLTLLVGGGIGLPPLIWLAEALRSQGTPTVAFCGARTRDLMPLTLRAGEAVRSEPAAIVEEFDATPVLLATDDGTLGAHGRIPEVFDSWLETHAPPASGAAVYACGPEPMLRATAGICERRGIVCHVCLERVMACGMGTCQSCIVRVRDAGAADAWRYRLCCTDGPVFDSRDVLWS